MNLRQKEILDTLITQDTYMTAKQLATIFSVTDRTIRTDISKLKTMLDLNDYTLITDMKKGYRIQQLSNKNDEAINIRNKDELVKYIMLKSLISADGLMVSQLADELYVSSTTISSYLDKITTLLEKENLISVKEGGKFKIHGNEMRKRFLISKLLQEENKYLLKEYLFSEYENDIYHAINEWIEYFEFNLSVNEHSNILRHLKIIINKRSTTEKIVDESYKEFNEYNHARMILNSLSKKTQITFNEYDLYYLTIQLLSIKSISNSTYKFDNELIEELIMYAYKKINDIHNIDFSADLNLKNSLITHLSSALIRIKYQMNIQNPVLNDIVGRYSLSIECAFAVTNEIEYKLGWKVNNEEVGLIAVYFATALDLLFVEQNDNISFAIITKTPYKYSLAELRLKKKFSTNCVDYYTEITEQVSEAYNIILTDYRDDKYIKIDPIINNEIIRTINSEVLKINRYINFISSLCTKESVIINPPIESQTEFFETICKELYPDESFKIACLEREEMMSTYIGNDLAIPHPINYEGDESKIKFVFLDHSIDWGGNKVRLVILHSFAINDYVFSIKFFETLNEVLSNKNEFADFLSMKDLSIIKKYK